MSSYIVEFASGGSQGIIGKTALSIPENTIDTTTTPVTLTGKGVSNYGQIQQTNFIQMLENFASSNPPTSPTIGQLWYKPSTGILYLCVDPTSSAITETTYFPETINAAPVGSVAWVQVWPSAPGAGSVTGSGNNVFTGSNTFAGSSSLPALVFTNTEEVVFPVAAGPTPTQNVYIANGALQYFMVDAGNNWAVNFAWSSTSAFNAAVDVNSAVKVAMIVTQGATPYFPSAFTIDGVSVTPVWEGGVAPTAGDASSLDVYTFTLIKTASATYTVLADATKYANSGGGGGGGGGGGMTLNFTLPSGGSQSVSASSFVNLEVTTTGGTGPYTYAWSLSPTTAGVLSYLGATLASATGTGTGLSNTNGGVTLGSQTITVYATVTDSLGATATHSLTLTVSSGSASVAFTSPSSNPDSINMSSTATTVPLVATVSNGVSGAYYAFAFSLSPTGNIVGLPGGLTLGDVSSNGTTGTSSITFPSNYLSTTPVYVTATNTTSTSTVTASMVFNIVATPLVNTVAPVASASANPIVAGTVLTCDNGTWTGTAPITYDLRWYATGNIPAPGPVLAFGSSITVTPALAAQTLFCITTAFDAVGHAAPATSNFITIPSAVAGPVVISNAAVNITGATTVVGDTYYFINGHAGTSTGSATISGGMPTIAGAIGYKVGTGTGLWTTPSTAVSPNYQRAFSGVWGDGGTVSDSGYSIVAQSFSSATLIWEVHAIDSNSPVSIAITELPPITCIWNDGGMPQIPSTVSLTVDQTSISVANGTNVTLNYTATISGGTAPYTYIFHDLTGILASYTTGDPTFGTSSATSYSWSVIVPGQTSRSTSVDATMNVTGADSYISQVAAPSASITWS